MIINLEQDLISRFQRSDSLKILTNKISKKYIIIVLVCLIAGISIFMITSLVLINQESKIIIEELNQRLQEMERINLTDNQIVQTLTKENEELKAKINSVSYSDVTIDNYLKSNNITRTELLSDLENNYELIPFEAILGGKMQYLPSESSVISSKWVLGYFEDGHIFGYSLLQYNIEDKNNIKWKVIDSYLME